MPIQVSYDSLRRDLLLRRRLKYRLIYIIVILLAALLISLGVLILVFLIDNIYSYPTRNATSEIDVISTTEKYTSEALTLATSTSLTTPELPGVGCRLPFNIRLGDSCIFIGKKVDRITAEDNCKKEKGRLCLMVDGLNNKIFHKRVFNLWVGGEVFGCSKEVMFRYLKACEHGNGNTCCYKRKNRGEICGRDFVEHRGRCLKDSPWQSLAGIKQLCARFGLTLCDGPLGLENRCGLMLLHGGVDGCVESDVQQGRHRAKYCCETKASSDL